MFFRGERSGQVLDFPLEGWSDDLILFPHRVVIFDETLHVDFIIDIPLYFLQSKVSPLFKGHTLLLLLVHPWAVYLLYKPT